VEQCEQSQLVLERFVVKPLASERCEQEQLVLEQFVQAQFVVARFVLVQIALVQSLLEPPEPECSRSQTRQCLQIDL